MAPLRLTTELILEVLMDGRARSFRDLEEDVQTLDRGPRRDDFTEKLALLVKEGRVVIQTDDWGRRYSLPLKEAA